MNDIVNHPKHYTSHPSGIECIQVTEHMGFNLGNAVKYIWRAGLKANALEDLQKAAWYVNREIQKRGAADDKITIPVGGKVVKLTKEEIAEAYQGQMRQQDYTKKTSELAANRKARDMAIARAVGGAFCSATLARRPLPVLDGDLAAIIATVETAK